MLDRTSCSLTELHLHNLEQALCALIPNTYSS